MEEGPLEAYLELQLIRNESDNTIREAAIQYACRGLKDEARDELHELQDALLGQDISIEQLHKVANVLELIRLGV